MRYACAILLLAMMPGAVVATDKQYSIGVHDFYVPEVHSHTYGINGRLALDRRTHAGRHLFGTVDVFVDSDQDDLDPDHIPIRWDVHVGTDGELWQGTSAYVGWTANLDTRMNTVSSVEREVTFLPALVARYDGRILQPSFKAGAGWFFLEIDDDVPKTRGYDRSDFRNSTFAWSAAAEVTLRLGAHCKLFGQAQQWRDGDVWLQDQYEVALDFDLGDWLKGSDLKLDANYYEYNLDVYQRPGEIPILPWNDDLLARVMFTIAR